jgi:signal transduction histidine kinase
VSPGLPPGHGDGHRLTQVVLNLVGNAIKFTDSGEVVINASKVDGSFKITVRDTGPGISESDQAKLFQEFQQADNTIAHKKGGTGAWGSQSRSALSNCTVVKFGSSQLWGRARRFHLCFRSRSNSK